MSDRERLGLPEHLVLSDLQEAVETATKALRRLSTPRLLAILEAPGEPLGHRIAAGNLLAIAGDPRIDPLSPRMIDIAGGLVRIGLETDAIQSIAEQFGDIGVVPSWIAKEAPRHEVTLSSYRMAMFPVTNQEYRRFLLETGHSEIPSSWQFRRYPFERANHPVYTVTASAADAYAAWLVDRTGRAFRLPTETEWEYAAAGPEAFEYPWGEQFDPALANTAECGLLNTAPVGAFLGGASAFGLVDMAGNVEEYVSDNYAAYPNGEEVKDHLAEIHGSYRVARGGGFSRFRDLARTRRRHGHNPRSETYAMGFRLAEAVAA